MVAIGAHVLHTRCQRLARLMLVCWTVKPPAHGCDRARVLLFVRDRSSASNRAAIAAFRRAPWPTDCVPRVIDAERDPETARWFGIAVFPTVAAVRDGVLLAVEVGDCSTQACERVVEAARERQRQLWRRAL